MLLQVAQEQSTSSLIVAALGLVGAGGAVKLLDLYYKNRKDKRESENKASTAFREGLQNRVIELEGKVEELMDKIEDLIKMYSGQILELSTEKVTLESEVKHLMEEIQELQAEINVLRKQS